MGLDVMVFNAVVPNKKLFNTIQEVEDFQTNNNCVFHDSADAPAILGSKFEVEIPVNEYDWDTAFKNRGLNVNDFIWYEESLNIIKFIPVKVYNEMIKNNSYVVEKDIIEFKVSEIPMHIKNVKGFFYEDNMIGYQRKGANQQFYNDGKWGNNTVVVDNQTLINDWHKYFSDENDEYYGGKARQHFKEHIIDNFVEGKTIVCYW